jgi:hypothetical protein
MTLSIARRHAGTTARSRTFFGLFEHTRREGTKTRRRQQKWIGGSYRFFGISLLISSNFLFCWQDYVLRIPREEILQG